MASLVSAVVDSAQPTPASERPCCSAWACTGRVDALTHAMLVPSKSSSAWLHLAPTGRLAYCTGRRLWGCSRHPSLPSPTKLAPPPAHKLPTSRRAPRPLPRASSLVRAPNTNSTSSAWWQPISASAPPPPCATNTRTPGRSVSPAMDRSSGSLPPTEGGAEGEQQAGGAGESRHGHAWRLTSAAACMQHTERHCRTAHTRRGISSGRRGSRWRVSNLE